MGTFQPYFCTCSKRRVASEAFLPANAVWDEQFNIYVSVRKHTSQFLGREAAQHVK